MRAVRVLGVGAVSCLGRSWAETWSNLLAGRRCRTRIRDVFPELNETSPIAAIDDTPRHLELVNGAAGGAALRLLNSAADQALAGHLATQELVAYGSSNHSESDVLWALAKQQEGVEPAGDHRFWKGLLQDSLPAGFSRKWPAGSRVRTGPWVYSSCTSSLHALLLATLGVRATPPRSSLVLGVDALSAAGIAGFTAAGAATATDCRPFSIQRDGMLVGEGAAALRLGARAPGESASGVCVLGAGLHCERYHPTKPDPSGAGFEHAMRHALLRASVEPGDVVGLVLHGTGTSANDEAESKAVLRVFPNSPPATSVKAALGHTMGASGLFGCLAAIGSSTTGLLPPTTLEEEASIDGIDLVTRGPRRIPVGGPVVVTGAAFGGNYAAFVFGAVAE